MKKSSKFIKLSTLSLILFMAAVGVNAQNTVSSDAGMTKEQKQELKEKRRANAEQFRKELNLTDAQVAQIKNIKRESKSKMEALKSNSTLPKEQRRADRKSIMMDSDNKIYALLTADQKPKYDSWKAEHQGKRGRK